MIREALLTPNEFSRPGLKLRKVDAIVLHWVGNPGTSAEANRAYFESLGKNGARKASAHYIIDAKEIVRCVPDDEVAYHVGLTGGLPYTPWAHERWGPEHPNWYCIGIEHCHPDWSGTFEKAVMQRSKILAAGLCVTYKLLPDDIILHWTVTGKDCPRWFVVNPTKLSEYRSAVWHIMEA